MLPQGEPRVVTAERTAALDALGRLVVRRREDVRGHGQVLRVGVDGVDGAGKSVLGDELAAVLVEAGLLVVRASVDGFHHPAAVRHARGRSSPIGFYEDSYDYAAMRAELLEPLSPGGSGDYRTAVYDVHAERPVQQRAKRAAEGTVLVVDGIFLHRPELVGCWDLSVLVQVPFAVSVPRGAGRGYGDADPAAASNRRYVEGQRHYFAQCDPQARADVVLDNTDLARPVLVRLPER